MILVADQDDGVAFARELDGFQMDLGDQRAGGVDDGEAALFALTPDFGRNAVGAENGAPAIGHFAQFFDKNGAQFAQFVHHMFVVDDFFADVNGAAVEIQGDLDHVDGAHHARAKSARLQKVNLLVCRRYLRRSA